MEKDMDKKRDENCGPCEDNFRKNLDNLTGNVNEPSQQSHEEKQQELESAFAGSGAAMDTNSDLMGEQAFPQNGISSSADLDIHSNADTCGRDISQTGIKKDDPLNSGRLGTTQALTDQQMVEDNIKDDSSLNKDALNNTDWSANQDYSQDDSDRSSKDWSDCGCGSMQNSQDDQRSSFSDMDNSDLMGADDSEIILINDVIFTDDLVDDNLIMNEDMVDDSGDSTKQDDKTQQHEDSNISGASTQSGTTSSGISGQSQSPDVNQNKDVSQDKKENRGGNMCM